ncbi:MAG: hypothetical protein ACYTBZ_05210 [Planctomycetota bacterium]|jgi:hypothetical protein
MHDDFTISILGETWRVTRNPERADEDAVFDGYCEREQKLIYLNPHLQGRKLAEVALHEAHHAAFAWLDEAYARQAAHDLAHLLWCLQVQKNIHSSKTLFTDTILPVTNGNDLFKLVGT